MKTVIGLIQSPCCDNLAINLKNTERLIEKAVQQGAQIICLQELFQTPYFPQYPNAAYDDFAESIPGPSIEALRAIAKKNQIVLIVPLFERTAGGEVLQKHAEGQYFNSAVVIDADGQLLDTYRKIHIPYDPLFYEKKYFSPGSCYRVYQTRYATFAVLICYDQWFPEAARIVSLMGADIIFYPTAIGTIIGHTSQDGDWHDAWEGVMRGHAIANSVHVAAINRTGIEDRLNFWGQSFVCDSFGTILSKAGLKEEILICPVDLSKNQRVREGWGFFANRRPDTYYPLVK